MKLNRPCLCAFVILFTLVPFLRGEEKAKKKAATIRVVVWDEQQPKQKTAYKNFLGNAIADYLRKTPGIAVRSMRLDDAEQGLSKEVLDYCQVLVWWGHVRQAEIKPAKAKEIVERIKRGQLSLIALHSAHWSSPFIEAMNERTRMNARRKFGSTKGEKISFEFIPPKRRFDAPRRNSLITPVAFARKFPGNKTIIRVLLPNCCFPGYRPDGKPSFVTTLKPDHPIAKGIPKKFKVPQTEMYDEPFHVPTPDVVVFEERWPTGEWFRSGSIWNLGRGKVFYFRPGHETYPVYQEKTPLKIVENAIRWLGR